MTCSLLSGKCVAVLHYGVRRQSAVKNCQSRSVRARTSQSYGRERLALNFAQDLNTHLSCINVVPAYTHLSDIRIGRWLWQRKKLFADLCRRSIIKIQKVKQRSAAAYFSLHEEVIVVQTDRTKACPAVPRGRQAYRCIL